MDHISVLPEHLQCKILSFLSTKEAVRTSMLSSKWRDTWSGIPEVSLRESDFTPPHLDGPECRRRFIRIVNKFLVHPNRMVNTFGLKLSLTLYNSKYLYRLPTILYSFNVLSYLKLGTCEIELPTGFKEFLSLRVLELEGCCINDNDLENLLSSCPNLKEFLLKPGERMHIYNPSRKLKICCPKIKKLVIDGNFRSLQLKTPCLIEANFKLSHLPEGINVRPNLVEAFGSFQEVKALKLHNRSFLKFLAGALRSDCPATLFPKLTVLAVYVDLVFTDVAAMIIFILQNSPLLQELKVKIRAPRFRYAELPQIVSLVTSRNEHLHLIEIYCYFIRKPESEFLSILLPCAPSLRRLKLCTHNIVGAMANKTMDAELRRLEEIQCEVIP